MPKSENIRFFPILRITTLTGNWHVEFFHDLFHILPYASAVVLRVIPEQIRRVIGGHQLDGCMAEDRVIIVETAPHLADRLISL